MAVQNFWEKLEKPFLVLAPMADVTDAAFRRVIAKYSKPAQYVTYTEFVSADGLCLAPEEGKNKLKKDLIFIEAERPIVAQLFTSTPEYMERAAALVQEMGFDGVDINMGCPVDAINKQGAGAELIRNPACAVELIAAAKRGAPNLPVSVKTRLGYNTDELETWLPALLKAEPAALILHARTRKEMSKVAAHWERVKRAVEIRNEMGSKTLIIGNGDVVDVADAEKKAAETGADGVMIGRGIFGKPWLFGGPSAMSLTSTGSATDIAEGLKARLGVLIEHTRAFEELLGGVKSFAIMKKHFKAYVEGFDGAKELRVQLMEATNAAEVEHFIVNFLNTR